MLGFTEVEPRLTHIKVEWLPPNCTIIVQPVDRGIDNALKIRYRKYLHEYIGTQVLIGEPPLEGIDILRVCLWVARRYNSLNNTDTVIRCFQKAGFRHHNSPKIECTFESIPADEKHILLKEVEITDPNLREFGFVLNSIGLRYWNS